MSLNLLGRDCISEQVRHIVDTNWPRQWLARTVYIHRI